MKLLVGLFLFVWSVTGCFAASLKEYIPYNKGVSLYKKEQWDEAIPQFQKALETGEESGSVYRALGDVSYKKGDFDQALTFYDQSLSTIDGNSALDVYYNMGNAYVRKQQYDKAIEAYTHVLTKRPDDRNAKKNMEIALTLLEQQQQQQQKQQNEQQEDQQEQQQEDQQEQEKDADQSQQDEKQEENSQQTPPPTIEQEQANQILKFIEENETDTRKKYLKKPESKGTIENDW